MNYALHDLKRNARLNSSTDLLLAIRTKGETAFVDARANIDNPDLACPLPNGGDLVSAPGDRENRALPTPGSRGYYVRLDVNHTRQILTPSLDRYKQGQSVRPHRE